MKKCFSRCNPFPSWPSAAQNTYMYVYSQSTSRIILIKTGLLFFFVFHLYQNVLVFTDIKISLGFFTLRPSPPEDQAGVIHAISPIWMKLGQIEGTTHTTLKYKVVWFCDFFPWKLDHPPWFIAPNTETSTKISIKSSHRPWLQNTMNSIYFSRE